MATIFPGKDSEATSGNTDPIDQWSTNVKQERLSAISLDVWPCTQRSSRMHLYQKKPWKIQAHFSRCRSYVNMMKALSYFYDMQMNHRKKIGISGYRWEMSSSVEIC